MVSKWRSAPPTIRTSRMSPLPWRGSGSTKGVDAIIDVPTSSVALAVSQVAKEKDKILLDASAAAMEVTADQCSPNTIVWSFDTYEKAHSTGGALVKQGKKIWTFVTADYVFGHSLEEQTAAVVKAMGGEVKGAVRYPFPETTDFSGLPAAGDGERRAGAGPGQCRLRHGELRQAGERVRPEQADDDRAADHVPAGRALDRPANGAGPDHQRNVLLEHERSHPRLHQAGVAADAEQLSQPGACQRLCDHAALPEDGQRRWAGPREEERTRRPSRG